MKLKFKSNILKKYTVKSKSKDKKETNINKKQYYIKNKFIFDKSINLKYNKHNKSDLINNSVTKFKIDNFKIFDSMVFPKINNIVTIKDKKNFITKKLTKDNKYKNIKILKNNPINNKYYKFNMSIYNIKLFLRNIKNIKTNFNPNTIVNSNGINKVNLFFENDIFLYNTDKIILFEIKGLFVDKFKKKLIFRNKIKELVKLKFKNLIFGVYSELSTKKINWIINIIDPNKEFFKFIIDKRYLINNNSKFYKTLNTFNYSSLSPENIILIDYKYQIDNSIKNVIIFPGIKKIDNNVDNLVSILIEIFNEIQFLNKKEISNYIENNLNVN